MKMKQKQKKIKKSKKDLDLTAEDLLILEEQQALNKSVRQLGFKGTLQKVWYLLSGYRRKIPVLFMLMVINSVVGLLGVGLVIPFVLFLQNANFIYQDINNVGLVEKYIIILAQYLYDLFNLTSTNQLAIMFGIIFLVIFIARIIIGLYLSYRISLYTAYASKNLAEKIYTVVLYMSYGYYLGRNASQTLFSMSLSGRAFGIISGLLTLLNDLLFIFVLSAGLTLLSPFVLIIGAIITVIAFITYKMIHKKLKKIAEMEFVLSKKQSISVYGGVHNFTFSRLFSAESFFIGMFNVFQRKAIPLQAYRGIIASLPKVVLEISVTVIFIAYALSILVYFPQYSHRIVTDSAIFAALVFKLMPSIMRVTGYMGQVAADQAAVHEFYEEYQSALNHKVEEVPEVIEPLQFEKSINIENVSFSYPIFAKNGREYTHEGVPIILNNVSFSIQKGQKIGIVGGSGCGKTTMIHVLMAFLSPTQGQITVDGINIHENMRRWQKNIGYVPQETLLMEDSIAHNIAFGLLEKDINKEKVKEVLRIANLLDIVEAMPQGIDTPIGDHGKRLSGGQRQRLGIARALYRDPSLIFFDEATSHLDHRTEKEVQASIDNLPSEKTAIIVAHRINTLEACDVIYKFDAGTISFKGSYKEFCKYDAESS